MHRRLDKSTSPTTSAGFTLVEILVSIAIIGLLIAISLPAIQSSRAAANRVVCESHLRQIGIAAHMYVETFGCLPVEEPGSGLFFAMLPYLEMTEEHRRLEQLWNGSMADQMEATATAARIGVYVCPQDTYATGPAALSYALNGGMFDQHSAQGAFIPGGKSWAAVTDGMSQTVLCSEQRNAPEIPPGTVPDARYGKWFVAYPYKSRFSDADLEQYATACLEQSTTSPPFSPYGTSGYLGSSAFYNHVGSPNGPGCESGGAMFSYPARSNHTGGVNTLITDGSVRFTADGIDRRVWRAMGSRNGGEVEATSF